MNDNARVLVIDDEPDIRELLEITLQRLGLQVVTASDVKTAKSCLNDSQFSLCFTDMKLPDGSGLDIVRHIASNHPGLPAAVITAHANVEAAVEALQAGAFDFVSKPVNLSVLRSMVEKALKLSQPGKPKITQQANTRMLGTSDEMVRVRKTIAKLARSQAPVFISGESGVGKELAAQMIHELGPRSDGPLIPVNCGAIPSELMESELFGHVKGSFTGANTDKEGLISAANGGTLFLDEVADLPLHMQVKLLRVIQEKSVRPIGANQEKSIDVRILSATHKNLSELVQAGSFRQDLYYRINVIELYIPTLRERKEDIGFLASHFLKKIAKEWDVEEPRLDPKSIEALEKYAFPGNVRELQNILERAITLSEDTLITPDDLQLNGESAVTGSSDSPDRGELPLEEYIESIEKEVIMQALKECKYNKTATAKKLGITFRALRYRLKKLDLD